MARAEPYKLGTCPEGVLNLTASVDTQADRLEMMVVGWGRGMEAWIIDHQVVRGDPADLKTWAQLDRLLQVSYPHAGGSTLPIRAAFVDSGGSATQEVYNFTRTRRSRRIFAIKGASRPGRPILSSKPSKVEVRWNGRVDPQGADLWFIGTDTAKDYLANRWRINYGAGQIHFSQELKEDFYRQITAEYRITLWKHGHRLSRWEKKQADRNEVLDLMVYNTAAAHYLGLHKLTDAHYNKIEGAINPGKPAEIVVSEPIAVALKESPTPIPTRPAPEPFIPPHQAQPARQFSRDW